MDASGSRGGSAAPVSVLQAAINKAFESAAKGNGTGGTHAKPRFIPARRFEGARSGYCFTTGDEGTGYYYDPLNDGGENEEAQAPVVPAPVVLAPEELLRQAEEAAGLDDTDMATLDAKSLRRMCSALDRKVKENMGLRLKYASSHDKFMQSEIDLHDMITGLLAVAGSPELYPTLVEAGAVATLVNLLTHENPYVAADVMELFRELTDADAVEDYGEEASGLVAAIQEANGLEVMAQRLMSLDEGVAEEQKAVFDALSFMENAIEVSPVAAEALALRTPILRWLLARIKAKGEADSNKQSAAELLAILVQGRESVQAKVGELGGIDTLLSTVHQFRSKDPSNDEEHECLENAFDALCCCIMHPDNRQRFVAAEGTELMTIILGKKRAVRYGAFRALDFATTRCAAACERFVDHNGLKLLFAVFMGKAKIRGQRGEKDVETEVEERCVSIIANLLEGLAGPSATAAERERGSGRWERVASKFVESEFEKCDRLMEVYFRYAERVSEAEQRLVESMDAGEEVDDDDLLIARHDAGLFTLQRCALVAGHLWGAGDPGLRRRLVALLHQKGTSLGEVKALLRELRDSLTGADAAEVVQRKHVTALLASMGEDVSSADGEAPLKAEPGAPPLPSGAEEADMEIDSDGEPQRRTQQPPLPPTSSGREPAAAACAKADEKADGGRRSEHSEKEREQDRERERERAPKEPQRDRDREGDRDRERDRGREKDERPRSERSDRDRDRERGERGERGERSERGERGERLGHRSSGRDRSRSAERASRRDRSRSADRSRRDRSRSRSAERSRKDRDRDEHGKSRRGERDDRDRRSDRRSDRR